ncbi:nicotinate (nicotinamide) nucleotide adenylyltransferase, partial [Chromobacterium piscinae]
MNARVGVFGGTFDPVHHAHLRMARAFADELALDEVRLIPAGQPYHRQEGPRASAAQRLDMVKLAIAADARLTVDEREIRRHRPAYTVDTLRELRAELGAAAELWFLVGGDSLAALSSWKDWRELFRLANLAVAMRPGFDPAALPPEVRQEWQARQVSDSVGEHHLAQLHVVHLLRVEPALYPDAVLAVRVLQQQIVAALRRRQITLRDARAEAQRALMHAAVLRAVALDQVLAVAQIEHEGVAVAAAPERVVALAAFQDRFFAELVGQQIVAVAAFQHRAGAALAGQLVIAGAAPY